jgi:hypothetical protein
MKEPIETKTALMMMVAVFCLAAGSLVYAFGHSGIASGVNQQASIVSQFVTPAHNATVSLLGKWQSTRDANTTFTFNVGGAMDISRDNGNTLISGAWYIVQPAGDDANNIMLAEDVNGHTYMYAIPSVTTDTLQLSAASGQLLTYQKVDPIAIGNKIFGTWVWNNAYTIKINAHTYTTANDSFELTLAPGPDGTVTGNYVATYKSPSRIDGCPNGADCVSGQIQDAAAGLTFTSNLGGGTGSAFIVYNPETDTLQWTVQDQPNGTYYAPKNASLARK